MEVDTTRIEFADDVGDAAAGTGGRAAARPPGRDGSPSAPSSRAA
ncbi:hypothetical protein THAOC_23707, partial [Thalassiosira oceanica]